MSIFDTILYRPLLSILIFFYQFTGKDLGLAIILLTIFIRLLFLPLTFKSQKSQKEIAEFQKKIEEIKKTHKDKEEQAKALISFYREKKLNPFSGFFWVLIQLPILFALYKILTQGLQAQTQINPTFLGIFDLSKPNIFFALLAGILQYFQSPPSSPQPFKDSVTKISNLIQKQMLIFISFVTFLFLLKFPSALSLYWITTSLFSLVFQKIFLKKYD